MVARDNLVILIVAALVGGLAGYVAGQAHTSYAATSLSAKYDVISAREIRIITDEGTTCLSLEPNAYTDVHGREWWSPTITFYRRDGVRSHVIATHSGEMVICNIDNVYDWYIREGDRQFTYKRNPDWKAP